MSTPYGSPGNIWVCLWVRHIGLNRVRLRMKRGTLIAMTQNFWFYGTVEAALTWTVRISVKEWLIYYLKECRGSLATTASLSPESGKVSSYLRYD